VPAPSPVDVMQSTRDSIRAIMMIRAYRTRGHLHADLDPLKLKSDDPAPELDPKTYGFTEADYGRKIFIDNVLGLEFAILWFVNRAKFNSEFATLVERLAGKEDQIRELREALDREASQADELRNEKSRSAAQLSALETRLEDERRASE